MFVQVICGVSFMSVYIGESHVLLKVPNSFFLWVMHRSLPHNSLQHDTTTMHLRLFISILQSRRIYVLRLI